MNNISSNQMPVWRFGVLYFILASELIFYHITSEPQT